MINKRLKQTQFYYYFFAAVASSVSALVYLYLNNYFTELVLVHTNYGTVQGFAATSRDGNKFYQFNALPYAKPPVGRLRFQPPVPIEPWNFRDATRMTPVCAQYDLLTTSFRGQEDCLFLNIYTKNNPGSPYKTLRPVMVFIHGGVFMFGGSWEAYGGRYFMDEDVVLVTINYRLGLLGFLNTGDEVVSGNMGLKDQLEALKFVKKIVRDFGGDPNRITIFGESAGGASVHLHMLSPQSKGYFQHAISQSGSAFAPWGFTRSPREQAIHLGNQVDCPPSSSRELVDCLRSLDVWKLIDPQKKLVDVFIDPLDIYGPSVENVTSEEGKAAAFLAEYPYKLAADGKTHAVPWINGINSHEGCYRSAWIVGQERLLERLDTEWDSLSSPGLLLFRNDSETLTKLRKYHFGDKEKLTQMDYQSLTDLIGDRFFSLPVRDAVLLHARHHNGSVPTYLYYFSERADLSFADFLANCDPTSAVPRVIQLTMQIVTNLISKKFGIEKFDYGTCHADELFQMMSLNPISILDITAGHPHYQLSQSMIKAWVKFAKEGDPGDVSGATWEKLNIRRTSKGSTEIIPRYLHLNAKHVEMIDEPMSSRLTFWHQLKLPRNLNPDHETAYNHDVLKS